jgi:hypothetical protein
MSELMSTLEFIRAYIDDLLCITKGSFEDHLSKLREVLARLQGAGLKVNAHKCFWGTDETEYLGYITTIEFWYSIPTIIILIGIQSGHNYCRNTVGL